MTDWQRMTAAELGRGIGAGRIDPVELAESFLAAIAAHPEGARIYARATPDRARAEAAAARDRARAGRRRGPLDGVPMSWKDLFDTAGIATEAGSRLLEGRVPAADAEVLAAATRAGLVCLGKTHMSELAFSGLGLNPMTATPPHVRDAAGVPGGSSSGAAASVAFGLAPLAIGSDTGGSVRIPAAWNDLVGLKTTWGRLSLAGVVPLCESLDTVGPIGRSVEDMALALAALEGGEPADLAGVDLRGRRIARLTTVVLDGLRPAPAAGFDRAVAALEAAGARVEDLAAPEVAAVLDLAGIVFSTEAYAIWRDVIEAAPERMFPEILARFRGGQAHSGADYVAALRRMAALRRDWAARVAGFDAVILPTAPILAPDAARLLSDRDYYVAENLLALRNTRIGNMLGLCALTLPTGVPGTGLQIFGPAGGEAALLRIGAAAEAALSA